MPSTPATGARSAAAQAEAEHPVTARRKAADALQAWLTLLPAAALAWPGPGALLEHVPTTASSGAGWVALLALPAAVCLVLRQAEGRLIGSTLLLAVIAAAALGAGAAGDHFAARQAFMGLATALVLALCGASLGPVGRRVLARGFALAALVWLVFAASDRAHAFTGTLGNTGDLSEAALPGAVLALTVATSSRGILRLAGLAAPAYALYAGLVPVAAGVVSFCAVALVAFAAARRNPEAGPAARLGLVISLIAVASLGAREAWSRGANAAGLSAADAATGSASSAPADAADADATSFGGVEFRWRTWRRTPALLLDHWMLGVGPGQFEREFPPYRDPVELELSSHSRAEPTPVEVEHAHNDWIEGVLEFGAIAGIAWLALLVLAGLRALGWMFSGDATSAGLGAAAVAVLTNALFNSPLLAGPAAPVVAWPLIGVALARRRRVEGAAARRAARLLPALATIFLVTRAGSAWNFVLHGEALARIGHDTILVDDGEAVLTSKVERPLSDALRACPDSIPALEKQVELLRAKEAPASDRIAVLRRILALRPYRFGALLNLGAVSAQDGRYGEARDVFERAAALDPTNPALRRNQLLLAIEVGDREQVRVLASGLLLGGSVDQAWLERSAAAQLLSGRPGVAEAILTLVDPELRVSDANASYALAKRLAEEQSRTLLADGAMANAHFLFARGHIADGVPETAVRSYRQSLRISRSYPDLPDGAILVKLELAAAQLLAERPDDARETLLDLEPTALHLRSLPDWAGQALLDAGLLQSF